MLTDLQAKWLAGTNEGEPITDDDLCYLKECGYWENWIDGTIRLTDMGALAVLQHMGLLKPMEPVKALSSQMQRIVDVLIDTPNYKTTMSEIAERAQIKRTSVAKSVRALETRGIVISVIGLVKLKLDGWQDYKARLWIQNNPPPALGS